MYFKDFYAWYFENNETEYDFDGEFKFKLENLKLDRSDKKEKAVWNVGLKPKMTLLKKMSSEEKNKSVSYSCSMGYRINSML